MTERKTAFAVNSADNVATALSAISPDDDVLLLGDSPRGGVTAVGGIPKGHKIALREIGPGGDIVKYGVRIGRATAAIREGEWVHLHNMESVYDERSGHLDLITGAPTDIEYE